jgi:hexosaminidase
MTMLKKYYFLLLWMIPCFLSAQQPIHIIPEPVHLVAGEGQFVIDGSTSLIFKSREKDLRHAADFFNSYVKNISGNTLRLNRKKDKPIELEIKSTPGIGEEGYLLEVTPESIHITANTKAGIVYGMETLFQTLPQVRTNAALAVPCMKVEDYPRFRYRGMHLDVCRHFFSPDMVKEYIDLLATYKFNTFHWHLCDDQGWRIEIKKYPLLTAVGAWRADRTGIPWRESQPTQQGEPQTYGGYYTQEQIREIVAYAAERNITIIPEIEMPGHAAAALAAYPWLSCTQQPQSTLTGGVYPKGNQSNYCVGNDSVFTFLEDVLTEVMDLFPSPYIHVGGDEVNKTSWKNDPRCQALKQKLGLKDENELQSYFIRRIENFLIAHHRKLIGWDEILEGGLAPEATVMSWRGESGGIQAAKMKHDVIMTPGTPLYFDHYQAGPEGEPVAIGGFNSLKMVYDYNPIPEELDSADARYVMGAQGNVWAEFISTREHLEYMVLPRMLALSEALWTPLASKDFTDFYHRLQSQFRAFDEKGYHYCPGNFMVDIKPVSENGKIKVFLTTEIPGADIYYTTDGSDPDAGSMLYKDPIEVDSSVILKAVTVVGKKVMVARPAQRSFVMHKAIGRDVQYVSPASRNYSSSGHNALTDGLRGTTDPGHYWHGFHGRDLVATIDLGSEVSLHKISIGCLQRYADWIFLPQSVTFAVSEDSIHFTRAGVVNNTLAPDVQSAVIRDFTVDFPEQKARFIRVSATNLGVCPRGHPGAGKPAWLFADEIMVY